MTSFLSDRILGVGDTADLLGVTDGRVRQLVQDGRLPAMRVGRTLAIRESDVFAFREADRQPGRPRLYEVILEPGRSIAHLSARGGGLVTLCGQQPRAAIVHPMGEKSSLVGTTWCSACVRLAPRYVVRYYNAAGVR